MCHIIFASKVLYLCLFSTVVGHLISISYREKSEAQKISIKNRHSCMLTYIISLKNEILELTGANLITRIFTKFIWLLSQKKYLGCTGKRVQW